MPAEPTTNRLRELATLFTRLGITAFGGPAAHIAMMHDEIVQRRQWLNEQRFLDLLGATNLIPGPSSTEMTMHIGHERAGWAGLITAGVCFITPAMLIVMALAYIYIELGTLPQANWLLYGIKPVVIAIVAQALWNLGRKAVKGWFTGLVGLMVFVLYLFGFDLLMLLFAAGLLTMVIINIRRLTTKPPASAALLLPPLALPTLTAAAQAVSFNLLTLFLTFLKVGSVLFGSGYVLLAFLQAEFVVNLGWLTEQQIIDAVAIGQVTPGPLFTTATFIGYILGGVPGAIVATIGIFLPSFFFVALTNPVIPRLRTNPWLAALLDGINVASLGLMAGVTVDLARAALIDPLTIALALVSAVLLFRFKLNTTWIIAGAALIGLLAGALGYIA